ncbi:hypothetical protein VIBNISFn27_p10158 [Vibrio nigripulchritudo SFn27]|uniref:Uncharacterized protein n=1 Tax=Vibrio nigripulchritudo TaxID=28173 RepID=A0A9P1NJZ0_9VIBR|nr:Protein of unknown function [Vibrio nigripulchritudo]CCN38700.1 hypothetical protein VIBNIAM115_p0110 [Vibrio nigripulchritudo AM115]CCN91990.1 hypothetical protein VIBNISFn27_p10158 [Vibrio nigripulchritudo SFn27]CCO44024.1 hypothetical protein VIBNISFn135_p10158 [Vibrio nigripulchritudo SFn135]
MDCWWNWRWVGCHVTWDLGTTVTMPQMSSPSTYSGPSLAAAKFINQTYPSLEQRQFKKVGSIWSQ